MSWRIILRCDKPAQTAFLDALRARGFVFEVESRPSAEERFDSCVDENGPIWNGSNCWLWRGGIDHHGYGKFPFVLGTKRDLRAHRWNYSRLIGPIDGELTIDHLCKVRRCVNPKHFELVTFTGVNSLRGDGPVAQNARKRLTQKRVTFSKAKIFGSGIKPREN